MTLQEKVLQLKLEAATAARLAMFWDRQIKSHGEQKAEAFYTHLGLNHIEKKGFEWEGLTLSREPTEAEKRCVKGIAETQETAKEKVTNLLVELRAEMITVGIDNLQILTPATYHTLILTPSEQARLVLREQLSGIYKQGRSLVAAELRRQGKQFADEEEDDDEELDDVTDLTNARVANDVQARLTGAIARFALLGLSGAVLIDAVRKELNAGSLAPFERAATGAANRVISLGRYREMRARRDEIDRFEYSALLDQNTCGPCNEDDGLTAGSEEQLPSTPNPECEGSDFCRCFIVAIAEGVH